MDKITILGIGSGGGHVVNYISEKPNSNKFDLVCIGTDKQMLECSKAHHTLQIGINTNSGRGENEKLTALICDKNLFVTND